MVRAGPDEVTSGRVRFDLAARAALIAVAAAVGLAVLPATCATAPHPPARAGAAPGVAVAAEPLGATGSAAVQLLFTGSDDGYLDACGCDDGLLGGLPRRHTLLGVLGGGSDSAILLSNGRLVTGATSLDAMKFETIVLAMSELGYDAVALTERELALGRERLVAMSAFMESFPFLATNLVDERAPDDEAVPALPVVPSKAIEIGDRVVLVLSAVASSRAALYRAADAKVAVVDPAAALLAAMDARRDAWKVVVLGQMSIEEAEDLAGAVPGIDVLVVEGAPGDDHPREEAIQVGETAVLTTGKKGKFVGTYRFGGEGELGEFRGEPVHDELHKSPDVQDVVTRTYRDRLLEEKPIDAMYERVPAPNGAAYVGADEGSCASCHPQAWEIWARSKHAHAWQTLVDQDVEPRPDDKKSKLKNAVWDPDCVKCHVTGFGEVGGYAGMEKEKLREARLIDVTCEACHGPAGDHAERAQRGDESYPGGPAPKIWSAEEAAKDPARALADYAAAERLCTRCHDPDNSPHFDLRDYWWGRIRGEQRDPIMHGRD